MLNKGAFHAQHRWAEFVDPNENRLAKLSNVEIGPAEGGVLA